MNVGSKTNLFPLNLVYGYLTGYWIDAKGNIWSTRQKAEPQPLKASPSGSIQLCMRSHNARRLLRSAQAHSTWRTHTEPTVATVTQAKVPVGWIIGSLAGTSFSFAAKPKVHVTETSVKEELERLAKARPGVTYVSFKVDRSATSGGVVWG